MVKNAVYLMKEEKAVLKVFKLPKEEITEEDLLVDFEVKE